MVIPAFSIIFILLAQSSDCFLGKIQNAIFNFGTLLPLYLQNAYPYNCPVLYVEEGLRDTIFQCWHTSGQKFP